MALPQKGKHLRIGTVGISRTGQLATRANVLAGSAQYRAHDRLVRIKFGGRRGIIAGAEGDNLVPTTTKSEKQKRCTLLCAWVGLRRAP